MTAAWLPRVLWGLERKMSILIQKLTAFCVHVGRICLLFPDVMAGKGLLPLPWGCAGGHAWEKNTPKTCHPQGSSEQKRCQHQHKEVTQSPRLHLMLLWGCFAPNPSQTIPHFPSGFPKGGGDSKIHPHPSEGRLIFRRQQQMG